jgi:hypothetical protein
MSKGANDALIVRMNEYGSIVPAEIEKRSHCKFNGYSFEPSDVSAFPFPTIAQSPSVPLVAHDQSNSPIG